MERDEICQALDELALAPLSEDALRRTLLDLIDAALLLLGRGGRNLDLWETECLIEAIGGLQADMLPLSSAELGMALLPKAQRCANYTRSPQQAAALSAITVATLRRRLWLLRGQTHLAGALS
jgi:hypothetical protein